MKSTHENAKAEAEQIRELGTHGKGGLKFSRRVKPAAATSPEF